ncbi:14240_t:CDS:1 [Funneliformis geosporum]|uniref:11086_t:CDS:1 n=1 Tax=Funneliformis geosporum TaxID=1117311 RepID=A0A9W4SFK8_9GLOM|nr:11086_t:CDS:1 [Funneliformis geosporum]CAI2176697.1 14240_t:CDS:1 [Funneliformis geosporum]
MSPITRSKTSPIRFLLSEFPTFLDLELAYCKALPRLQQDAEQILEKKLEEHEVKVHFYKPSASPEYWFVNNREALEEVVYYKMKIRLFMRYKKQFMDKEIDFSNCVELKLPQKKVLPHKELFSCGTLPVMNIYNFGRHSTKEGYEKEYSFFHEEEAASSSTVFYQSPPTPRNFSFLSHSFKFESSQTLLGDYTDTEIDDTASPSLDHHHNGRAQLFNNILRVINCHQFPINWLFNLRHDKIYFLLMVLISFSVYGYMLGFNFNEVKQVQQHKVLIKGRLDGTVRVQVQEFIEQEMLRVSSTSSAKIRKGLSNDEYVGKENDIGLLGYVRTQLHEVLQEQLEKMMEGTSADYALYTGGARILNQLTSRNYEIWPSKSYQRVWGRLTHRNVITSKKPEVVLSPNVNVGECWCFNGTNGQIGIKLSRSIIVTHLTYSHIGKEVSIDPISSAPFEFELWGLNEKQRDFKVFLGKYQYDLNGRPTQVFNVPDEIAKNNNKRVDSIVMKILSNHENSQFTCLYRLQVHGVMPR